ncbi:MAG: hypothetical protein K0R26_1016 [Bacteroidota bacterium]|jgi:hypothetical protein|nr:hypothetical protein [Bacteroidota bacterium]
MKKSIALVALAFGVTSAFAQLSTRENDENVIKYGARPKAGDMAFVLGTSIASDSGMTAKLFSGNALQSGNILTYKYYKTDDLVIRAGLRLKNNNSTLKGTGLDSSAQYNPHAVTSGTAAAGSYANLSDVKNKTVERMWEFVPGVEKHFLASNIFDAYVGADLYLGFGSDRTTNNFTYKNGDKNFVTSKTNTTKVGLGLVSGFNVFLGHLPVSLGLEYGWNAKWTFGGVTKVKEDVTAGTLSYTQEYKTDNSTSSNSNAKYSKLKKREFNADSNQDVRVVLHIYFARK